MSTEEQKEIANKIYENLRIVDPHCILAGGAPRDWYFNKEAKDLDFYFVSTARTINAARKQLEALFGQGNIKLLMDKDGHRPNEMYKCMPNLLRIWEMKFGGQDVQLIQLGGFGSTWKVLDNMDVSICKAYYLPEQGVKLHPDFKLTLASKIMFVKDGYEWNMKHGQKMIEYFKNEFYAGTKEQAKDCLVRKALKEYE